MFNWFLLYKLIRTWNLNFEIAVEDIELYFIVNQCYNQICDRIPKIHNDNWLFIVLTIRESVLSTVNFPYGNWVISSISKNYKNCNVNCNLQAVLYTCRVFTGLPRWSTHHSVATSVSLVIMRTRHWVMHSTLFHWCVLSLVIYHICY